MVPLRSSVLRLLRGDGTNLDSVSKVRYPYFARLKRIEENSLRLAEWIAVYEPKGRGTGIGALRKP